MIAMSEGAGISLGAFVFLTGKYQHSFKSQHLSSVACIMPQHSGMHCHCCTRRYDHPSECVSPTGASQ